VAPTLLLEDCTCHACILHTPHLVVAVEECRILHLIRLLLQAPVVAHIEVSRVVAQPAAHNSSKGLFRVAGNSSKQLGSHQRSNDDAKLRTLRRVVQPIQGIAATCNAQDAPRKQRGSMLSVALTSVCHALKSRAAWHGKMCTCSAWQVVISLRQPVGCSCPQITCAATHRCYMFRPCLLLSTP
jgi:hypothetical protein